MNMEDKVREAIVDELNRQVAEEAGRLQVRPTGDEDFLIVEGRVDLEALAMHVVGAVSGGP
jgi:hypothetical protein